jgi:dihydrofolate reductase
VSLDGVFEEPGRWSLPFFSDDVAQFKYAELQASDALLLGRKTYEGFAAAWPTMQDTGDFGDKMNSMPKYVVTSTLDNLEWTGSERLQGDVLEAVRELKAQPGRDLLLAGSGELFATLSNADLIDVYRLMVHPIVLGAGPRLFAEGISRRTLRMTAAKVYEAGVVVVEYEPVRG